MLPDWFRARKDLLNEDVLGICRKEGVTSVIFYGVGSGIAWDYAGAACTLQLRHERSADGSPNADACF
jgi:hypothetical protein